MGNPRVVFVDVFIDSITPLQHRVELSAKNNPQLPVDNHGNIIFENDHHPGFEIHFELQGDTQGYFFPPTPQKSDAVWSQRGSQCPDQTGVWEVFRPIRIASSGNPPERRTLIVHNKNPQPAQGAFQYNLRVTDGTHWLDLDPGGTNNNGASKLTVNYLAVAAVGATTGILSAVATTVALAKLNLVCPMVPGL